MQDKRLNYQKRLGGPVDIEQFMDQAKRVIDDQQMLAQQKLEIG